MIKNQLLPSAIPVVGVNSDYNGDWLVSQTTGDVSLAQQLIGTLDGFTAWGYRLGSCVAGATALASERNNGQWSQVVRLAELAESNNLDFWVVLPSVETFQDGSLGIAGQAMSFISWLTEIAEALERRSSFQGFILDDFDGSIFWTSVLGVADTGKQWTDSDGRRIFSPQYLELLKDSIEAARTGTLLVGVISKECDTEHLLARSSRLDGLIISDADVAEAATLQALTSVPAWVTGSISASGYYCSSVGGLSAEDVQNLLSYKSSHLYPGDALSAAEPIEFRRIVPQIVLPVPTYPVYAPTTGRPAKTWTPHALSWHVDWESENKIWGLDHGGSSSTAAMNALLDKMVDAGMLGLTIKSTATDEQISWVEPLLSSRGLKKLLIVGWSTIYQYCNPSQPRVWYHPTLPAPTEGQDGWSSSQPNWSTGSKLGQYWFLAEALHTSYDDYAVKRYGKYSLCHSYRGFRYDSLINYAVGSLSRIRPDFYLIDHETYRSPENCNYYNPGMVERCTRCQSIANARAAWAEITQDHVIPARQANPAVYCNFFRTDVYFHPDSPDGPCYGLYDNREFHRRPYTRSYLSSRSAAAGGYHWLMMQPSTTSGQSCPTPTADQVYDMCMILAENGALGFAAYIDNLPYDSAWRLIKAGNQAFVDYNARG